LQYDLDLTLDVTLPDLDKPGSLKPVLERVASLVGNQNKQVPVICVCRRGNDSQIAVNKMKVILDQLQGQGKIEGQLEVKDILGGLTAWSKNVDAEFPTY